MPHAERGQSATGFRMQLLQRIRNEAARTGTTVERHQQRIAFERLLSRLPRDGEWVLKGGLALQFRYGLHTRATKDVDLLIALDPRVGLDQLRAIVATAPSADHFTFEFGEEVKEFQGAPGGTPRIPVTARVAGVTFREFHLDLSSGDAMADEPERLVGSDFLAFAGIAPVEFPVYPIAQHLAEKLHAYTLPRTDENTRAKDLVDLVYLAATESVSADRLERAVEATFARRATHAIPARLPDPPASWAGPFRAIARETPGMPTDDLVAGHQIAARFWDHLLAHDAGGLSWSLETAAGTQT